jgi:hypothetical protein
LDLVVKFCTSSSALDGVRGAINLAFRSVFSNASAMFTRTFDNYDGQWDMSFSATARRYPHRDFCETLFIVDRSQLSLLYFKLRMFPNRRRCRRRCGGEFRRRRRRKYGSIQADIHVVHRDSRQLV